MKFYVVLAVTVVVVLGAFFYSKHQTEQTKSVALSAQAEAAKLARMRDASLRAEQDEAALAGKTGLSAAVVDAGQGSGHASAADLALGSSRPDGLKRVKVAFDGQAPEMKRKQKKFDHFQEEYIGGPDDDEGFKFSSAQYSHTKLKAERAGTAGNLSDDLLIVESRLEESVDRSRN